MLIGKHNFEVENHTYVMGILNVTPDSFSDGGRHNSIDSALYHAEKMIKEGAAIIDVGGESTRPGYTQISDEEEIFRVSGVIEEIKRRFDIPVSLDTYKAKVAAAGIRAGADLINDIWGLKYDSKMAKVIAENNVACCLMHNRKETVYQELKKDLIGDLKETVRLAEKAGISADKIILDPGVGFAKNYRQNLEAIALCPEIKTLGYPVLLGTSRKSVIGQTLDKPTEDRVYGTVATSVLAVIYGCSFVRVHDVAENIDGIRMAAAVLNCDKEV